VLQFPHTYNAPLMWDAVWIIGWDQVQHGADWGQGSMLLDAVTLGDDMSIYLMLAPGQLHIPLPPQVGHARPSL
jgi:hypothetical protein